MSALRETNYSPDAPVLFRLPHIEHFDSARHVQAAATGARADAGSPISFADHGTSVAQELTSKSPSGKSDRGPESPTIAGHQPASPSVSHDDPSPPPQSANPWDLVVRQSVGLKRSVILVLILVLIWGAWLLGRQSGSRPPRDIVADQPSQPASLENVATTPVAGTEVETDQRPKLSATPLATIRSVAPSDPLSISEPADEAFYGAEDFESTTELNGPVGSPVLTTATPVGSSGESSATVAGTARPDGFGPGPTTAFSGAGESAAAGADLAAGADGQTAGWYQDVAPTDAAANGGFLRSETPNSLAIDPIHAVQSVSKSSVPAAPVLSPTPNGIIDWSRYFPQNGSVRAASAVDQVARGGEAVESTGQAFYSDDEGAAPADSDVAPFYR